MVSKNEWTVKDLREALAGFDDGDLVVLSRDEEGNGFGKLWDAEPMAWDEQHREVHYRELTPELVEQGYADEDVDPDGRPCVVLWP